MDFQPADQACISGSPDKANEDYILITDGLYVVLDGATGLGKQLITTHPSDAVWFVEKISFYMKRFWHQECDFVRALSRAIKSCSEDYNLLTRGVSRPDYELPSAGLAAIAIENGVINAYRLGDCAIYSNSDKLKSSIFEPSFLEELDTKSIKSLKGELSKGSNAKQAREAIMPMLRKHRSLMNKPNGYGSLSLTQSCIEYIDKKQLNISQGESILLASDGFSCIENYCNFDVRGIFNICESLGLEGVVGKIRKIENEDSKMESYPRLKIHDDSTALLLNVL